MISKYDEEGFLLDQLQGQREQVHFIKNTINEMKVVQKTAEKRLEEITEAFADYMKGNGLKKTTIGDISATLGESKSIVVDDVDALPEEYVRTKTVKEANKILIKENAPDANWYTTKIKQTITLKATNEKTER